MFTLLGFMGMYTVLGIFFLFLVHREIERGPEVEVAHGLAPQLSEDRVPVEA
jgi:cytochrome d ubiquinol oxidase subunit I